MVVSWCGVVGEIASRRNLAECAADELMDDGGKGRQQRKSATVRSCYRLVRGGVVW